MDVTREGGFEHLRARRETGRISIGTRQIEAYRAGMDQDPDTWTAEGVKGGLIQFYREIAGVGLVFPRADRQIAVDGGGMGRAMRSPPFPLPLWSRAPPSLT
jgi:hypothetical protein